MTGEEKLIQGGSFTEGETYIDKIKKPRKI